MNVVPQLDYTFRIRFQLSANQRLAIPSLSWSFRMKDAPNLVQVTSSKADVLIKDSQELIATSAGWSDEESARQAGESCQVALIVAFAHANIGADFGRRAPKSIIYPPMLEAMSREAGHRVLQNFYGVQTYLTHPEPSFLGVGAEAVAVGGFQQFEAALTAVATSPPNLSTREKFAFDLLNASHFETSPETRFISLVMAVEVLLEAQPRAESVRKHVDSLMALNDASDIPKEERDSIRGTLRWLYVESIGQGCKRLARERLAGRTYMGLEAQKIFRNVTRFVLGLFTAPLPLPATCLTRRFHRFVSLSFI